jgi:uncharacterized membrane protein
MRNPKFRRFFHECLAVVLVGALLAFAGSFLTGDLSLRMGSLLVAAVALWLLYAAAVSKDL